MIDEFDELRALDALELEELQDVSEAQSRSELNAERIQDFWNEY